jgi:hypothetical protein
MTFKEWWESTGRAGLYQDEPVIEQVAEAAWDAQQAIIDAAPHDSSCWKGMSRGKHGARQWECNCWKAESKKASEDA